MSQHNPSPNHTPATHSEKVKFDWKDPFLLEQQLTETERMIRDSAAAYCQEKLQPRVRDQFRHETVDRNIFREMGELGLLGQPYLNNMAVQV